MMNLAIWGALVLLGQGANGSAAPGTGAAATTSPECPSLERHDLTPSPAPFRMMDERFQPFEDAVRADLVGGGCDAPVLMVRTASALDVPETAVFVMRAAGTARAKVTVRRYRVNVWVAMHLWFEARPKFKSVDWSPEAQRTALAGVSRKVDTFAADLDADVFEAIVRVWSLMLERAGHETRRSRIIVFAHVKHYFQNGDRSGIASGRAKGSAAERLIALGNDLISYASEAPELRPRLGSQLVAAAAALEAYLKALKVCTPGK